MLLLTLVALALVGAGAAPLGRLAPATSPPPWRADDGPPARHRDRRALACRLNMPSTGAPTHRSGSLKERRAGWPMRSPTGGGQLVARRRGRGRGVGQSPRTPTACSSTCWPRRPGIRWVQLPCAGIEQFVHLVDDDRLWTCGKGVYAEPVAELALTLALAGHARPRHLRPGRPVGAPHGARTCSARRSRSSAAAASPSRCCACSSRSTATSRVVRNRVQDMDGADVVLESELPHRRAARRRSRRARPRPDPGHRGHHQRQRARADGAPRVARERGPGPPHRHRRPGHGACGTA